ncbi:4Fe-4S ferredoxin iron-sulfur binding domain protein [Denitrovibrio acetiphilus DSM 12809]|uniref:4Fe-4S ferredoxin iron-sulfur binding domain protein n=1 Tax=Denitrovibrio acetiphilus (strain DSM 12809 / NBRC 114555 / N2460) TaxID=522772 RepID=D4H252_DENA2|nr:4Fe-4S binding protein [Denitrovibrio acetiphilus]ADD67029.1 4Fe-4S ferredoxin iron-sulfur binding domain protein [Denitrovibrio acetiphilus DSM 12809]
MKKKLHIIYFSPTGTTLKILLSISKGFPDYEIIMHDLTRPEARPEVHITDGVVLFGVPVYAGRVQVNAVERMKNITGADVPAAAVVVYGNRAFEDALVELKSILKNKGFIPVAAGAFIGEHSYADAGHPVALGRPDAEDDTHALDFGRSIASKVKKGDMNIPDVPGNVPYKELALPKGATPKTDDEKCIICGACKKACPTGAMIIAEKVTSNPDLCIMCMACAKVCPRKARYIDTPQINERIEMLVQNCHARREPQFFL